MQFSRTRLLGGLVVALFCFLVLATAILSHQQQKRLRNNTVRDLRGDLDLIAFASTEALLKSDYISVRNFVAQWGNKRAEHHEFQVVAPNGFVIAEHKSPAAPAGETLSLTREIMAGKTRLATVRYVGDFQEIDKVIQGIRRKLVATALLLTTLLGTALWLIFRNMAIGPLEDAVRERTRDLLTANQELEQLTNNSPT